MLSQGVTNLSALCEPTKDLSWVLNAGPRDSRGAIRLLACVDMKPALWLGQGLCVCTGVWERNRAHRLVYVLVLKCFRAVYQVGPVICFISSQAVHDCDVCLRAVVLVAKSVHLCCTFSCVVSFPLMVRECIHCLACSHAQGTIW